MKGLLRKTADTALFLALPVLVFMACTAGQREVALEIVRDLPADAAATMPDPSTVGGEGGISPTTFWLTWGASLVGHEVRKIIRLFTGNNRPKE